MKGVLLSITSRAHLATIPSISRWLDTRMASQSTLEAIQNDLVLVPDIISIEEETSLLGEIEPLFKRMRYESSHIDHVIKQYREITASNKQDKLPVLTRIVRDRIYPLLHDRAKNFLPLHILDLAQDGAIGPHLDHLDYSGNIIGALSLLSDRIIRFHHVKNTQDEFEMLVPRRSFYLQTDTLRYSYTHEVCPNAPEPSFNGALYDVGRRISIMVRNPHE